MQAELDKYKQKEREWEKEKTELKQENDSLKLENSRLLAQVYPEVFGCVPPSSFLSPLASRLRGAH